MLRFGYGGIVLAVVTMLAGIEKAMELNHISAQRPWNTAVIAPIATTCFILIVTTVYVLLTAPNANDAAGEEVRDLKDLENATDDDKEHA